METSRRSVQGTCALMRLGDRTKDRKSVPQRWRSVTLTGRIRLALVLRLLGGCRGLSLRP